MTKRTMPSRPPREHLSPDLIGQYLFGKLPERTRNRVERHLLECDFCSDAVEGYAGQPNPAFAGHNLEDLRRRLDKRVRRFRFVMPFGMQPYAVAAAVILLVTCTLAVWMTYFYRAKETRSAQLTQGSPPAGVQAAPPVTAQQAPPQAAPPVAANRAPIQEPANPSVEAPPVPPGTGSAGEETMTATKADQPAPVFQKDEYMASVREKSLRGAEQVTEAAETREDFALPNQATPPVKSRGISRVVRGRVTDAVTGAPLPGVSIVVKGADTRTLSDARGDFALEVPAGSPALVFNLVGMTTEEQDVRTADYLRVQLEPDAESLSDVVVIGYGEVGKQGAEPVTPVGGMDEFNRYVKKNLRLPDTARQQAVVRVECVVQADGRLGEFVIRKSAGEGYDREAIRVLKEGPRWHTTTRQRGKSAQKKVTLRIPFKP